MKAIRCLLVLVFIAGVGLACTTVQPPTAAFTAAQTTVDQARSIGASEYAPLELNNAEENLEKAEGAIDSENYEEAERYIERARADAEVAIVKTNAGKSQKAAGEIRESLDALHD